jgi:ATP-dependent Clp protease ATP-binding subunit ClpA
MVLAQSEARTLGHNHVGTEHILFGLLRQGKGVAADALSRLGVSLGRVEERLRVAPESTNPYVGAPPFTASAKRALELAMRESLQLGHAYIATEHLLLGLVRESEGLGATILIEMGVDLSRVRQEVIGLLSRPPTEERTASDEPSRRDPAGYLDQMVTDRLADIERIPNLPEAQRGYLAQWVVSTIETAAQVLVDFGLLDQREASERVDRVHNRLVEAGYVTVHTETVRRSMTREAEGNDNPPT